MTPEQIQEDINATHAIFDLCGVRKTNRGSGAQTLRMRALILANEVPGIQLTQTQVDEYLKKSK